MRIATCLVLSACLMGILAQRAEAQSCPNPTTIHCGDSISGNSSNGSNLINTYTCYEYSYNGPEMVYLLDIPDGAELQVDLYPDDGWLTSWDAILVIMPELDGDCYPSVWAGCSDEGGYGGFEGLAGTLPAGRYYIVVDGYDGDYGSFDLSVSCTECTGCADGDGDGYSGYNAGSCPCGDDCNDSDPLRNPAAKEVCGNQVDENCDGTAVNPCPTCSSDLAVTCGESSTASTDNGSSNLNEYCGSDYTDWSGDEFIFEITPAAEGTVDVVVSNMGGQQLDAFAFTDFGVAGNCNKDACVDLSAQTSGTQHLAFYALADETYYVAVDGRGGDHGSFSYAFSCINEQCATPGTISCGQSVTGDTSGGTNNISAYPGLPWSLLGSDLSYAISVGYDARITAALHVDDGGGTPPDLALVVIADDGNGACLPAEAIAVSDYYQDEDGNPPEVLSFSVLANTTYYLVVEGLTENDYGGFTLSAECVVECPDGMTDCSGNCVDLDNDTQNCGTCDNACSYANAQALCVAGTCSMTGCDSGFGDCNTDDADGCETALGTIDNCSACGDACAFDHAAATCVASVCTMGDCQTDWGDCANGDADGCETALDTSANCGACGTTCSDPDFCYAGSCTSTCPGNLTHCDDDCIDTTSDPANCGGCGVTCQAANATTACHASACLIGSCEAGFGDCDASYTNGCETTLGTISNCASCADACAFENAGATCDAGVCAIGSCDTGYGDCNTTAGDGCESPLNTDAHCGSCTTSCGNDESCVGGQCQHFCADADEDGYKDINCGGDDCNDDNDSIYPGAAEICEDGIDQDCDGSDQECTCADNDGDGYRDENCGGDDCDDTNGYINPGVSEICGDDIDQDCDGVKQECDCPDTDGDGHPATFCGGDDCNDNNASIHPGSLDVCGDGIDQDCDGADRACPSSNSGCGCSSTRGDSPGRLVFLLLGLVALLRRRV